MFLVLSSSCDRQSPPQTPYESIPKLKIYSAWPRLLVMIRWPKDCHILNSLVLQGSCGFWVSLQNCSDISLPLFHNPQHEKPARTGRKVLKPYTTGNHIADNRVHTFQIIASFWQVSMTSKQISAPKEKNGCTVLYTSDTTKRMFEFQCRRWKY